MITDEIPHPAGRRRERPFSSRNSKLRDELLNGVVFYSLVEAPVAFGGSRRHCNTKRPHSSLGYKPPASETLIAEPPSAPQTSMN